MPKQRVIQTNLVAAFITICCVWIALPYGSVTLWARSLAPFIILTAASLGLVVIGTHLRQPRTNRVVAISLMSLLAWCLLQCVPLPVSWLGTAQPAIAPLYDTLFPTGGTTSISVNQSATWNALLLWVALGWLAWICAGAFGSTTRLGTACLWIAALGTCQAMVGFVTYQAGGALNHAFAGQRFVGTFSGPNTFGGYLAITLPITLGVLSAHAAKLIEALEHMKMRHLMYGAGLRTHLFHAGWLLPATLLQAVALVLSASRSSLLISAATVTFLLGTFVWQHRNARGRRVLWMFFALLLIILVLGTGGTYTLTASRFREAATNSDLSMQARIDMWKAGSTVIRQHPLGVGLGAFPTVFPRFQPSGLGRFRFDHAHNDYVQFLCELGWPGILPAIALFLWLVARIRGSTHGDSSQANTWIRRALALAVLAALFQAGVEFNLSSRPGYQVLFAVVIGLMCVQPARTKPLPAGRPRRLALAGLALSAIISLHWAWKVSPAATAAHHAWTSFDEPGDPYFWKRNRTFPPELASDIADQAAARAPRQAQVQYLRGRAHVVQHEQRVAERITELQEIDPSVPYEVLEASLRPAERVQRTAAFAEALTAFSKGLQHNPWSMDLWAEQARALYETAATDADSAAHDSRLEQARHAWETAQSLGPNDMLVRTKLCQALAAAYDAVPEDAKPDVQAAIRELGNRVLQQDPTFHRFVFGSWFRAGIGLNDILAIPGIPPNLFRDQFRVLNLQQDSTAALACLAAWEKAMQDPAAWPERMGTDWIQRQRNGLQKQLDRGWSRWLLRTAQWREHISRSQTVAQRKRDEARTLMGTYKPNTLARKLALKKLYRDGSATPNQTTELYGLLAPGDLDRPDSDQLTTQLLVPTIDDDTMRGFEDLLESNPAAMPDDLRTLLAARMEMRRREHAPAANHLMTLLRADAVTLRFRHRVHWLLAQCEIERGREAEARLALLDAWSVAPNDPLVLASIQNLDGEEAVLPSNHTVAEALQRLLGPAHCRVSFQSETIVMTAFDISQATMDNPPPTSLKVHLQFFGRVPPDLVLDTACLPTAGGPPMFRQQTWLKDVAPIQFGAGLPQFGSIFIVHIDLPSFAYGKSLLRIGLRSPGTRQWIATDDGLRYVEIEAWETLISEQPLTR